jgi:Uma2 family endonuclease
VKGEVFVRLRQAARGLPCRAFTDGMAVRIGDRTVYEPDAMLRCGPDLPDETLILIDPVVVIEVTSPSSSRIDATIKGGQYFRLPSLRHYLVVDITSRTILHHLRPGPEGDIVLRILPPQGVLPLDPPGIAFPLEGIFDA